MANAIYEKPLITLHVAVTNKNGKPYIYHVVSRASTMEQAEFSRIQDTLIELLNGWGYNVVVNRAYLVPSHFKLISTKEFSKLDDVFLRLDLSIFSMYSRHPHKVIIKHFSEVKKLAFRKEALEHIEKYFGLTVIDETY